MTDDVERVRAPGLVLVFEARKCIHSRNCVLSRPDVFVPNVVGEWLHPERATAEDIAALAQNCPSGAIRYERSDGGADEQPPRVNVMRVRENGPNAIAANLTIVGHGKALRATLCRCGASQRKPFCDGSHAAAGFTATGEPAEGDVTALAHRDGELVIEPTENGPLVVTGNLEVCTGTGHPIARVTDTALCRCGHSQNKPFCDGSHERVGFKAPA
jgi:CDGSH-type Zn-finger protein/uncharacterized Fe-S cluster protein YjdI